MSEYGIDWDGAVRLYRYQRKRLWRWGWATLLMTVALVSAFGGHAMAAQLTRPATQSSADPLVLAFYYTWFDENTWSYDQLSDLPAELYVSRDRAAMGRHIEQAKMAGIDAFLVAWYGPGGETNQTEPNLTALLEEAAARNFKIGILFETDSPFLGGTGAIGWCAATCPPSPCQPTGLFARRWTTDHLLLAADHLRRGKLACDPQSGRPRLWQLLDCRRGVDTSYLALFDGHYLYSNTWSPPADLTYTNQKFANLVGQARATIWGQQAMDCDSDAWV